MFVQSMIEIITHYIEHALEFERLADQEPNSKLRAALEEQAWAYRKLAAEKAERAGLPAPSAPQRKLKAAPPIEAG
jgi:hypothetical protein